MGNETSTVAELQTTTYASRITAREIPRTRLESEHCFPASPSRSDSTG
jgi:hypothetical protein